MTRKPPALIMPPGSIPATTQPGNVPRSSVFVPPVTRIPQPNGNPMPGFGPGFALWDHVHAGGSGIGGASPNNTGSITTDKAVALDGAGNHHIAIGSDAGMPSGNPTGLSIEAWVKLAANTEMAILGWGTSAGSQGASMLITDHTHIEFTNPQNAFSTPTWTVPPLDDGSYHYIVATYDGTTWTLYADGSTAGTRTNNAHTPNILLAGASGLILGNDSFNVVPFNGDMDELAIYSYVLTSTQVGTHFSNRNTGLYRNKVIIDSPYHYYRFEEPLGATTCIDEMGVTNLTYGAGTTLQIPGAVKQPPQLTAVAGAAAGTSPPTPAAVGNNQNMTVSFGTGTGPSAGEEVVVSYTMSFTSAPTITSLVALNSATAALTPYISSRTGGGFGVGFVTAPAASQATGTYQVSVTTNAPTP